MTWTTRGGVIGVGCGWLEDLVVSGAVPRTATVGGRDFIAYSLLSTGPRSRMYLPGVRNGSFRDFNNGSGFYNRVIAIGYFRSGDHMGSLLGDRNGSGSNGNGMLIISNNNSVHYTLLNSVVTRSTVSGN